MSVLDFPTSPTNGQYYNGFIWNAANETWDSSFAPRAATIPITSPNYIINGAFDINQRNFTSTTVNTNYGFDRWSLETGSGTSTYSTQAFTSGSAPVAGYEAANFARIVTSGQTGTVAYSLLQQPIEDVRTLAGRTVTVSFWAKAGSGTPKIAVSLDQRFGSGGSPSAIVTTPVGVVTTSTGWARYSVSVALPSLSGKTIGTNANTSSLLLRLWVSGSAALDPAAQGIGIQNNTFDFWGVQVEEGSAPTEFRRNAPNIQGELAACQRYYYRSALRGVTAPYGAGYTDTSTTSNLLIQFPVQMRVIPTSVDFSGLSIVRPGVALYSVSNVVVNPDFASDQIMYVTATHASAGASYVSVILRNAGSTSGYLGLSAEL